MQLGTLSQVYGGSGQHNESQEMFGQPDEERGIAKTVSVSVR